MSKIAPLPLPRPRILLIDDALTVRLYCRTLLEAEGFEVAEAINGAEALERALNERFDLFSVDINMQIMDGLSFLRNVRATPALVGVPALMLSSETSLAERERAFAAGANYYLAKPLMPNVFLAVVRALSGIAPLPQATSPQSEGRAA